MIVGEADNGPELKKIALERKPALIISSFVLEPSISIDYLIEVNEEHPTPNIIVAFRDDLEAVEKAMEDHVMAFLIDPVSREDLEPTILVGLRRFEEMQALRGEVSELKDALKDRKKLERAKGILMVARNFTEEEAYLHIRGIATKKRMKMREVADMVVDLHTSA